MGDFNFHLTHLAQHLKELGLVGIFDLGSKTHSLGGHLD